MIILYDNCAIVKKMADKWCEDAVSVGSTHTKLAFDQNDTWSLKYNIVWDKLLDIGLFEEKIFANEVAWYKQKMKHYGVPLDSRKDYTKLDWLFWTTVMTSDKEYFTGVVDAVFDMICDTEDRVPMTDYYDTSDAHQRIFQARSVLGGIFINFLVTIQDTP